MKIESFVLIMY